MTRQPFDLLYVDFNNYAEGSRSYRLQDDRQPTPSHLLQRFVLIADSRHAHHFLSLCGQYTSPLLWSCRTIWERINTQVLSFHSQKLHSPGEGRGEEYRAPQGSSLSFFCHSLLLFIHPLFFHIFREGQTNPICCHGILI